MPAKLRTHVRNNLIGYLALFIALNGTAYAAVVSKNSVTSKSIKDGQVKARDLSNGAVRSAKVADGSLLQRDFAAGQLPTGAQGPQGPQGRQGDAGPQGQTGTAGQNGSPDTASQVLAKVEQVDGAGSGLDADRLGGSDSADIPKKVADVTLPNFDFGGVAAGRCVTLATGLAGPQPGDFVLATVTNGDSLPAGFTFTGAGVPNATTTEANLCNHTASAATGPVLDVRVVVVHF